MSKRIYFMGDPGPQKCTMLNELRDNGVEPERVDYDDGLVDRLTKDPPLAVIVGEDVSLRRDFIAALRDREELIGTPVIASLASSDSDIIAAALDDGADDFIVGSSPKEFKALLSLFNDSDSWNFLRAPKGMAVLAEGKREERIKIAHGLKRIGFDVNFAATAEELAEIMPELTPRIVVASCAITEKVFGDATLLEDGTIGSEVPWIVLGDDDVSTPDPKDVPGNFPSISLVHKKDGVDGITFVINEIITPAPPNIRKSKRLLYGTPVAFGCEGGEMFFHGYSYNINMGGLFVRTLTPLPMGTRVKMRMRAPFGDGEVVATAQVVWISKFAGVGAGTSPPGMGFQFVNWAPPDRAAYEVGYELLLAQNEHRLVSPSLDIAVPGVISVTKPPPKWWSPHITA